MYDFLISQLCRLEDWQIRYNFLFCKFKYTEIALGCIRQKP